MAEISCSRWMSFKQISGPDELVFEFELFEGMVISELAFVFKLFEGMVAFKLFIRPTFDFPDGLDFFHLRTLPTLWRRGHLWTVCSTNLRFSGSTWIFLVFKLVVIFELVNVFELFDRSSTFRIWIFFIFSAKSWSSLNCWTGLQLSELEFFHLFQFAVREYLVKSSLLAA